MRLDTYTKTILKYTGIELLEFDNYSIETRSLGSDPNRLPMGMALTIKGGHDMYVAKERGNIISKRDMTRVMERVICFMYALGPCTETYSVKLEINGDHGYIFIRTDPDSLKRIGPPFTDFTGAICRTAELLESLAYSEPS